MLELKLNHIFQLTHINGRKEFHGEDRVTAVDLDFTGEIKDAIVDRFSLADDALSDTLWRDDEEKTVRHPQLGTLPVSLKYEQHQVKLFSAILDDTPAKLILNQCKLTKIKLTPKDGGIAKLSFQIQGEVADNEKIGQLFNEFLGSEMKLVIQPQQTDLVEEANKPVRSDTSAESQAADPGRGKAKSAA